MAFNDYAQQKTPKGYLMLTVFTWHVSVISEATVRKQYNPEIFGNINYHAEAGERLEEK